MPAYKKGTRPDLMIKKKKNRKQLRETDEPTRGILLNIYNHPRHSVGTGLTLFFLKRLQSLSRVLIHLPFGICLETTGHFYETVVPKSRRIIDDWQIHRIGTRNFHMGLLFGLVKVLVAMTTQRIVYYIPPFLMEEDELLSCGPDFVDFTTLPIERSVPCWPGHVASMAPILALAVNLLTPDPNPLSSVKQFFSRMGELVLEDSPNKPDLSAMAELLQTNSVFFTNTMLDAIDNFI